MPVIVDHIQNPSQNLDLAFTSTQLSRSVASCLDQVGKTITFHCLTVDHTPGEAILTCTCHCSILQSDLFELKTSLDCQHAVLINVFHSCQDAPECHVGVTAAQAAVFEFQRIHCWQLSV